MLRPRQGLWRGIRGCFSCYKHRERPAQLHRALCFSLAPAAPEGRERPSRGLSAAGTEGSVGLKDGLREPAGSPGPSGPSGPPAPPIAGCAASPGPAGTVPLPQRGHGHPPGPCPWLTMAPLCPVRPRCAEAPLGAAPVPPWRLRPGSLRSPTWSFRARRSRDSPSVSRERSAPRGMPGCVVGGAWQAGCCRQRAPRQARRGGWG